MGIKTQLDLMMTSANSRAESSSKLYKERKGKCSSQRKQAMFSHLLRRRRKENRSQMELGSENERPS